MPENLYFVLKNDNFIRTFLWGGRGPDIIFQGTDRLALSGPAIMSILTQLSKLFRVFLNKEDACDT